MTRRERQSEISKRFHHIGDVAALTGLSADALRAWERVGLLTPQRSSGHVRQYTEDDIARVRLIARTLQRGGFSRNAVAMLLRSGDLQPDAADYTPGAARVRPLAPRSAARNVSGADETRSDRRMLTAIARVSDALASGRSLDRVLEVICAEACWSFGISDTILWLPEQQAALLMPVSPQPERRIGRTAPATSAVALVAVAASGQHCDAFLSHDSAWRRVPMNDPRSPPLQAFLTRQSAVLTTAELSPSNHPELLGLLPAAALLSMPLLAANGQCVGVLTLREALDTERFDADNLERIRLFATHAALAIETAHLHASIRAAQKDADMQRAHWQAAMDDMPALVCICDGSLRITYVSPTCQRMLGWPAKQPTAHEAPLPGSVNRWVSDQGFFWLDDDSSTSSSLPAHDLPLPRALREQKPIHNITVVHQCADGTERVIVWNAARMVSADDQLLGAVAFGRDITTEYRLRAREAGLIAVARAAASVADSKNLERFSAQILNALVENMHTPKMAASLYLLDSRAGVLRPVGAAGGDGRGTHAPVIPISPQHPWWQSLVAGPTYSTGDRERPAWLTAIGMGAWKASSVRAWATAPLRTGDRLIGALAFGLSVPHVWDAGERTWLEACAATITMAIENGHFLDEEGRMFQR